MKLYSLINNKRLTKFKILKKHNFNLYLLLGATILILGGFFYSQATLAKIVIKNSATSKLEMSMTEKKAKDKNIINSKENIKNVSSLKSTSNNPQKEFNLKTLQDKLDIKKIASRKEEEKVDMELKKNIAEILTGTPMEKMIDPISKQDKIVAAFLVGIALKESGFGKHSPVLNGKDCYNYWGYRGKRARMGTGGHTCFNSPEDAVKTVSKRIHTLAVKQNRNTPRKMLIWKCGSNCNATGGWPAAYKWVKDVSIYFNKINNS